MDADFFKLKYSNKAEEVSKFLVSQNWETRPNLTFGWIIRNIDNLYFLTDFRDTSCIIGFMVFNENKGEMIYFEILKAFRKKKYAKSILKQLNIKTIYTYANSTAETFWIHLGFKGEIHFI